MSLFVLDTDTLTLLQRRNPLVCERAAAHATETAITVLTVEEQLSGWYGLLRKAKKPDRLVEAYRSLAENVRFLSQLRILDYDAPALSRYEELKTEMIAQLRKSLTGRYRMLEREAAKTAIELNLANTEFQNLSNQVGQREKEHTQLQETCYRTEAELRDARQRLADLQLEQERTRGKLDYQAQQIGAIEERLTTGDSEAQELEKRQSGLQQKLELHLASLAELEPPTRWWGMGRRAQQRFPLRPALLPKPRSPESNPSLKIRT